MKKNLDDVSQRQATETEIFGDMSQMWTTQKLLVLVSRSKIQSSCEIEENELLQTQHAQIVALLKAFDLYVEENKGKCDQNFNIIKDEYAFDMEDFLSGNFIKKRSMEDAFNLMKSFVKNKITEQPPICIVHFFLGETFKDLIGFRRGLQQSIDYRPSILSSRTNIAKMLILDKSQEIVEQQIEQIDAILLKIIGDKDPVSEKDLIEKYGYPEHISFYGKTEEEILAML